LLVDLTRVDEALPIVRSVLREATDAGDERDAARARLIEAYALGDSGRITEGEAPLREAIRLASRAGDDDTVAEAWTTLYNMLAEISRLDEAKALHEVVAAAVARAGDEPRAVLDFLESDCSVSGWTHEYERAAAHFDRVFAPAAATLGDEDIRVMQAAVTCAELLLEVDRDDDAEALVARALASARTALGESSFVYVDASRVTGLVLLERDQPARAREHLARVATWADARPGHTYSYYAHYGLAEAWRDEGNLERAAAEFELARRAAASGGVESDYRVSIALGELGKVAWQRGDLAEAERAWVEAVAMRRRSEGPAAVTARGLSTLGAILAATGDRAAARTRLEEALAMFDSLPDLAPDDVGLAGLRLARVLWSTPADRARALELVRAGERIRRYPDDVLPIDGVALRSWVADVCERHGCPESRAPTPPR
jgi:tetratricopeptide (TPR) repeat protein